MNNSSGSGWQNPVPNIIKDREEPGYFLQGGANLDGSVLSKIDRTITFRIINTGAFTAGAVLFGSDGQPDFDPFFGASFIIMPDLSTPGVLATQARVRREAVGNPFLISGIKMFFPNAVPGTISEQQSQPLRFVNQSIYGKNETLVLQTLNAISPTNFNNAYLDIPEAGIEIDPRSSILYNILPGEEVWIYFTVKARLNAADFLFSANPKIQQAEAPRITGNPLYDIVAQYNQETLFGITPADTREASKDLTPELPPREPVKGEFGTPPPDTAPKATPVAAPRVITAPELPSDDCM